MANQVGAIRKHIAGWVWVGPSAFLLLIFTLFPVVQLFASAFGRVDFSGRLLGWGGLHNFNRLLAVPEVPMVMANTVVWTVACVSITTVISLGIALLVNEEFVGRKLVRAMLIIPWAASQMVTALVWRWIYDFEYGALNVLLGKLGILERGIYWLATPETSFPALIVVGVFVSIPFTTFTLLAGLQGIPTELYEAARIDGASTWQTFRKITLPLLKPSLTISTLINSIYTFNNFTIVWSITRGDPASRTDLAVTYLYKLAFTLYDVGGAAALSVLVFAVLLVFTIFYVRSSMRGGDVW